MSVALLLALAACGQDPVPVRAACAGGPPAHSIDVDATRLLADVAALADDSMQGRALGTDGGRRARRFLEGRARGAGLAGVRRQPVPAGDGEGANLVALVPGTRATAPAIVVTAHYDHLGARGGEVFNGADDNASGAAALLALAAHLRAHPPAHPVVLAWLDGEELGLRGAAALVADPPVPLDAVAVNVNLDMVGRSARGELYVAGTGHRPWLAPYVRRAACATTATLLLGHDAGWSRRDDWTTQSDHSRFHEAGIPFLYLGVEDHPDYHRPSDDVARLEPAFLAQSARAAIALVLALDADLEAVHRRRAP
jgi:Zn-dependent M28 family amino/carboxypeptidase